MVDPTTTPDEEIENAAGHEQTDQPTATHDGEAADDEDIDQDEDEDEEEEA